MLVLVAERDHYAADLSEYFLRTEGYDVRIALDGQEAQRLQNSADLVILELLLPGGSAIEVVRHQFAAAAVPVLAVSSLAMRDAAVQAGASALLLKPLDPLQLVSTVRDLIGTSARPEPRRTASTVPSRLASGNPGLDTVLAGGLAADSINLICGPPGSGKTILAQRYVFENATADRPAVYLSTVSEPFEKIIRYGQTGPFDPAQIGKAVFYEDLGASLVSEGLAGAVATVDSLLKQYQPGLVVIEAKALAALAESEADYRRLLHHLAGRLSARGVRPRSANTTVTTCSPRRVRRRGQRHLSRHEADRRAGASGSLRAEAAGQRLCPRGAHVPNQLRRARRVPSPRRRPGPLALHARNRTGLDGHPCSRRHPG